MSSRSFATKEFLLGLASNWTQGTTDPAVAGRADAVGSRYLRSGAQPAIPNTSYLKVNSTDNGWSRQNLAGLKVQNIRNYGALGIGGNDTAAFNAAVTAAIAAGGGIVYIPPGDFGLTKPASGLGSVILSNVTDLVFMGDGYASHLEMIGSSALGAWYGFRIRNGSKRIRFVNFRFDGANITSPDPTEQNIGIYIQGVGGDAHGGPSDIECEAMYFGRFPGDAIDIQGESGQVCDNVRTRYNCFDMTDGVAFSRSAVLAQRYSRHVMVHDNWVTGSHDNQLDFEPTGGGADPDSGPQAWGLIGNMIDHASVATSAITLSGITSSRANERCVCNYNVVRNGGQISGLDIIDLEICGNIVMVNSPDTTNTGCIDLIKEIEFVECASNILINQNATGPRPAVRFENDLGFTPHHVVIADNICQMLTADSGTAIRFSDCTEFVISGNIVRVDSASANQASGIGNTTLTQDVDHDSVIGNIVVGVNAALLTGTRFSATGFSVRNLEICWNLTVNATQQVLLSSTGSFLDWRTVAGNVGIDLVSASISLPGTAPGTTTVAIEGNSGPSVAIALMNHAAGPAGAVAAPQGTLLTNLAGGQATTLFYKDSGAGVSGGTNGWLGVGATELTAGALASSTATARRFLAPGSLGLPVESSVEIQWTAPRAGILRNLRGRFKAGVGAGNNTYTVRKNGVDTTLTFTISNTATSGSDITHSVAVAAGDLISYGVVKDTAPGTPQTNVVLSHDFA